MKKFMKFALIAKVVGTIVSLIAAIILAAIVIPFIFRTAKEVNNYREVADHFESVSDTASSVEPTIQEDPAYNFAWNIIKNAAEQNHQTLP